LADTGFDGWYVEEGIGEARALMTVGGQVLASKLQWPGEFFSGQLVEARLISKQAGKRRGTVTTDKGAQILVDHLPAQVTEGQTVTIAITRASIAEKGRHKLAQGRVVQSGSDEGEWLAGASKVPEFASGCWEDIWQAASTGVVEFAGGSLTFSVTPAMTLIDVDGEGAPRELALAAVPAIAKWLLLFDLGGNIGIDFPTLQAKADRRAVDDALEQALIDWPHERTAMNGFGFVQIVARFEGPSLLHRFATSRTGMCARYAMRLAERTTGAGVTLVTVHPALKAKINPAWLDELRRRTGREVRIESDPGLALEAPSAQVVSA